MLYGKILWSAYPHAEIIRIDTSKAESVAGVALVITAKDIPGKNQAGILMRDQPAIAAEKVRYIGDGLAAVFADSLDVAEKAIELIEVEYRPLPGVFTPEDAAKPDAPLVHEKGNLLHQAKIVRADVDAAFEQCAVVAEDTFTTPMVEHGFLELESGLAFPDGDGGVTIQTGSQSVFDDRTQLSEILALPEEKVRVIQLPMGGAFGGKEDLLLHQYLALGALMSGRPVKMVLCREESLRVHVKRHPAKMHFKLGADSGGKLLALQADILVDSGAYASLTPDVLENMVVFAAGPYFIPALKIEGRAYYTNNVLCGAMRGFGVNQVAFALEQLVDSLARSLSIDPFEMRLRNALEAGLPTAADDVLQPGIAAIKETLIAARQVYVQNVTPPSDPGKRIGVGVASAVKNVGYGHGLPESAGAIVELSASGKLHLKTSQHEYGQGSKAGLSRLVNIELGIAPEDIDISLPDTATTPPTGPTTASRQTFLTGNAVVAACRKLKGEIAARAAEYLNVEPEMIVIDHDHVVDTLSGRSLPLSDLGEKFVIQENYTAPQTAALLTGEKSKYGSPDFRSLMTHWCYIYSTQVAVVEVDLKSGDVDVLKVIAAVDVGTALNITGIEGQIEGGVMMGLGYALSEQFIVEQGINTTKTLHHIHLPGADKTPEIIPVIVEVPHPFGPNGVKGFAEGPSLATAPAILNAIYDAIGLRVTSLPANKDRVKSAIKSASLRQTAA
jgi:CO/xanthine dehydrogenase Mo-binding subunit